MSPKPASEASSQADSLARSLASETFGNPGFKGCRWCRRPRSAANPYAEVSPQKPLLPFRSERHNECLPCTGKLRRKNPDLTSSDAKSTYAKKLASDEKAYKEHMKDLAAHEQDHLQTLRKRQASGKPISREEEDLPAMDQTVNLTSEAGLEMRKLLGVLWPLDVYERVVGKKPLQSQISKITQGGEVLAGVLRPKSEGQPEGTTEVYDVKKSYGSNIVQAASSKDAIFEEEVSGAWDKVKKLSTMSAEECVVGQGDSAETLIQLRSGLKRSADDFDSLMDWGPSVSGGPSPQ